MGVAVQSEDKLKIEIKFNNIYIEKSSVLKVLSWYISKKVKSVEIAVEVVRIVMSSLTSVTSPRFTSRFYQEILKAINN